MENLTLNVNLVRAIQSYLGSRPFNEVANIMLVLQQQINAQMPPEQNTQETE